MYGAEPRTGYRPEMASIPRGAADANRSLCRKKNNKSYGFLYLEHATKDVFFFNL